MKDEIWGGPLVQGKETFQTIVEEGWKFLKDLLNTTVSEISLHQMDFMILHLF